jgi:hypothetical protein
MTLTFMTLSVFLFLLSVILTFVSAEQQCTRANFVDVLVAHRATFNAAEWFAFRSTHAAGAQIMIGAKVSLRVFSLGLGIF